MKKKILSILLICTLLLGLTGCGSKYGVYVTSDDDVLSLSKDGSCTIGDVNECNWHEQEDGNILIQYAGYSKTEEKTCIPHKGNLFCGSNYYEKK